MTARWLALSALAACTYSLPPVPSHGGPAWVELHSEHFTLWTDAGAARGRELIAQLEHLRQVIYGVAFPGFTTSTPSFVIALQDSDEVHEFVARQFAAVAFTRPLDGELRPMIVMPADDHPDRYGDVLTHELSHLVSHTAIHRQPHWFAEGLAMFFETTKIDATTGHVEVGTPAKHMVRGLPRVRLLRAADLFACTRGECMDFRFYLTAWALYSFLINTRAEELMQLEAALDHGAPLDVAWDASVPSLPRDAIDRELRAWLQQGSHRIWSYTAKLRDPPVTERPLGDADVYAARALLRYSLHTKDPQLATDLKAALAANPAQPLANAIQRTMASERRDQRSSSSVPRPSACCTD